jgi:exopolysaccharide biosynthesis polyprenyl glycosylphosphotransferase
MPDTIADQKRVSAEIRGTARPGNAYDEFVGASFYAGASRKPKFTARTMAALQIFCLAAVLLMELVGAPGARGISAGQIINAVLLAAGFGLVVNYWTYRRIPSNAFDAFREIVKRLALVAGLLLTCAILATSFGGGSWDDLHLAFTAAAMVPIVSAEALALFADRYLDRFDLLGRDRTKPRCIVVFGDGDGAFKLAQSLRTQLPESDVCIYPTSNLKDDAGSPESLANPFYADPRLVELAPDVALITPAVGDKQTASKIILHLAPLPIDVLVDAKSDDLREPGPLTMLAGLPFVRLFPRPLPQRQRLIKRLFDVVVATILVVVLLPVLLLVAVLIKLDSRGPVLFRQPRVGFAGSHFTAYKFRTMRAEATDVLADKSTVANDPRVTGIGAFLRRSSIDELPQLFNVVGGSMSLVGPRPHALNSRVGGDHFSKAVRNYHARHRVKPGITGLAQVLGWRGPTETQTQIEQRVANDLRYISNWSLKQDLLIIFRTFFALSGKNAF